MSSRVQSLTDDLSFTLIALMILLFPPLFIQQCVQEDEARAKVQQECAMLCAAENKRAWNVADEGACYCMVYFNE